MKEQNSILMKKSMTKKQMRLLYSKNRSRVGLDQKLGTKEFKSSRDYDRKQLKEDLRRQVIEE